MSGQSSAFVHLHVHTAYSLLDGAIRIEDLVRTAKNYHMSAVAITDHGNMFGVLKFYKQARKAGLNPIIGCEVYLAPRGRRRRDPKDPLNHLVLLAQNNEGYQNLTKLVSLANLEGFYYKPRIDFDLLEQHNKGLIALSACLQGEIPSLILMGREEEALKAARRYAGIFEDRFYLEVQKNFMAEQDLVNQGLLRLASDLDLPLIATNDCHYLNKTDAEVHDILLCIQTGKTLEDENRMKFPTSEFNFKSPEEMTGLFKDFPDAVANTLKVAELCQVDLPKGHYHFPDFPLEKGESLDSRLISQTRAGFEQRLEDLGKKQDFDETKIRQYRDRLEHELNVIIKMGFAGYFLIVADFINHARQNDIPVGPGRGSAAGSLVAYALGITDLDPIRYGLLFERFLNEERVSMPDIDVDFCTEGREQIIRYVTERYGGQDHVAQIITFGQMQARAVIRDVGRALGMPYGEVDRIAKMVPNRLKITLAEAMAEEPRLLKASQENPQVAKLLKAAQALEALPRHASTHAAGVVIADKPLVHYLPLYCVSSDQSSEQNRVVVTQFDMKGVEEIGLIKFDFLGLKTLTLINQVLKLLESRGIQIDPAELNLEDPRTYELLGAGDTTGVFQLESSGMREILVKLKPSRFEDVIALVALYRPGPLKSGMVDNFIQGKHGQIEIRYELPELEPILKDTYGVILYQEQVMEIASRLADYSLGEADLLRRAMGKKIPEEMAKQRGRFMEGARANRIDQEKADKIFDLMANFAEYGFNKSHSAAYALIAFQTAYLKAHFRTEFMAALLTSEVNNQDKIVRLINECREKGIVVLPPDINESWETFTVVDQQIRFGLAAIKGVGQSAIEAVVEARKEKLFTELFDFCERVDHRKVNRRVIEALIKCGAFDSTGVSRAQMAAALDDALDQGGKFQRERDQGQTNLFVFIDEVQGQAPIRWPGVPEWRETVRLAYEKESLGFYITGHPLARHEQDLAELTNTNAEKIKDLPDKTPVRLGGVVVNVQPKLTKKGDRMAFVTLEDLTGLVEIIVFPDLYRTAQPCLESDKPVLVSGELTVDEKGAMSSKKIKAKEIMPLEEALEKMAARVVFNLSAPALERKDLDVLRSIVASHPGRTPVLVNIHLPGRGMAVLRLNDGVRPSRGLLRQTKEFLGENVVTFKYS